MKKDLIIGGCTNYGINQLKPWVLSTQEHMPDADKVMCEMQGKEYIYYDW